MDKFTITFAGATLAELYASAAEFASRGTISHATSGHFPGPTFTNSDDADDAAPLNINAPAVDGDGVPWDDRIHSSNKQMTDKGVWRKKRGIQDSYYQTVTAELKARGAAAPAPAPAMPMPTMPPGMPGTAPASMPVMPQAAPAPMPTPAPTPCAITFGEFMAKYSAAVNAGKVTPAEFGQFLASMGVADLPALNADATKLQQLYDWMLTNGKL